MKSVARLDMTAITSSLFRGSLVALSILTTASYFAGLAISVRQDARLSDDRAHYQNRPAHRSTSTHRTALPPSFVRPQGGPDNSRGA